MAVAEARRSNKRRKLSPPTEDETHHSKKTSKTTQNDTVTKTPTVPTPQPTQTMEMPSVKGLDSSEPAIRRTTLKSIFDHLESRPSTSPFTHTQALQLWRGFFVATYMHDSRNALSVQNLLREIAATFGVMAGKDGEVQKGNANVEAEQGWLGPYHSAFWETVTREWAGIDSHRMNKYLLLVRFVVRELFTTCLKDIFEVDDTEKKTTTKKTSKKTTKKTNEGTNQPSTPPTRSLTLTESITSTLSTIGPLNPSVRRISDGLRLHLLDIWNDELSDALTDLETAHQLEEDDSEALDLRKGQLTAVLSVLREAVEKVTPGDCGAQKHVRVRAKETVKGMDEIMGENGGGE